MQRLRQGWYIETVHGYNVELRKAGKVWKMYVDMYNTGPNTVFYITKKSDWIVELERLMALVKDYGLDRAFKMTRQADPSKW